MWYIIGAIVIIAVALGIWLFSGQSLPGGVSNSASPVAGTQNTSLKNLLASQSPQSCTFSTAAAQTSSQGIVYVAGGKMRGDFTSTVDGKGVKSHMIVMDNTSYVWSDAMPQGVKMSFDTMATQTGNSPQGSVDPNATTNYDCSSWSTDVSMFVLPAGITFQDLSNLPASGSAGTSATGSAGAGVGASQQCAACNQITDSNAKAQCLAALHCGQ